MGGRDRPRAVVQCAREQLRGARAITARGVVAVAELRDVEDQPGQRQPPAFLFLHLSVDLHQGDDRENQAQHIERTTTAANARSQTADESRSGKAIGAPGRKRRHSRRHNDRRCAGEVPGKFRQQPHVGPFRSPFGQHRRAVFLPALENPFAQLLCRNRPVGFSVVANYFIHGSHEIEFFKC